jgi:hypothetical protein
MNVGMDRFDADMVNEDLRKEFGSNIIVTSFRQTSLDSPVSSGPAPSQTVSFLREKTPPMYRRPTNSELSVSKLMDSLLEISGSQNEADGKRMVLKAVNAFKREMSKKVRDITNQPFLSPDVGTSLHENARDFEILMRNDNLTFTTIVSEYKRLLRGTQQKDPR